MNSISSSRPTLLYKYMPFNDQKKCIYEEKGQRVEWIKKIISDKSIFVPSVSALNDPFEQAFSYEKEEEVNVNVLEHNTAREERQKNTGVLSLSSDYKNMLLWAHYSSSHKGICFEFSNGNDYFKPVCYKASLPKDIEDFNYIKSHDWSYEKEFRFVNSSPNNFVELQKIGLSIESIILGSGFEDWEIFYKEILPVIDNIPIYKMKTSLKTFQMEKFFFGKDQVYKILALGIVKKIAIQNCVD